MGNHGCCAGKRCTTDTCMDLPKGKTCGDCWYGPQCFAIYGHQATDKFCDWFPRQFADRQRIET